MWCVPCARVNRYTLRTVFCFLAFEAFVHFFYIHSMAQTGYFRQFLRDPMLCLKFALLAVLFLYLKFLFIWRLFRTWALIDGITPPENMPQCESHAWLF